MEKTKMRFGIFSIKNSTVYFKGTIKNVTNCFFNMAFDITTLCMQNAFVIRGN